MNLTPINSQALPQILDVFDAGLKAHAEARVVFRRIAATRHCHPALSADIAAGRMEAVSLATMLDIPTPDEEPAAAFFWDGCAIRTQSATSVVFREIAHWQIAPIERRGIYDFGLGAGPETGRVAEANTAACVDQPKREEEENLASLLGILWEAEYEEPAVLTFAEQNWLELYDRAHTHLHFVNCLEALHARRLIDARRRPQTISVFSSSPKQSPWG